eukprot:TRINITY_DN12611_c0_g4_i4.p1 TRINITY_DN12611_c0_g4~~TRINITY_DN12611_c0_g4_i4.p1  ORF type:complete len:103 (+),score=0.04 TRINITY_DN12611_c0_g4_i4:438-746(+)
MNAGGSKWMTQHSAHLSPAHPFPSMLTSPVTARIDSTRGWPLDLSKKGPLSTLAKQQSRSEFALSDHGQSRLCLRLPACARRCIHNLIQGNRRSEVIDDQLA